MKVLGSFSAVMGLVLALLPLSAKAAPVSDLRARIINQYLVKNPPEKWDYDWTTAIFLYGAASSYRATDSVFPPAEMRRDFAKVWAKRPAEITMPDLAAMSLPAVVLLDGMKPGDPEAERTPLQATMSASKAYLIAEPKNAGGVFDHVGLKHRFKYLPPTHYFMPSSVWADSSVMYGLNAFMMALHDRDDVARDFAVDQVLRIHGLLWDSRAGLYKHAYFFESKKFAPAKSYWARGNLWMTLSMTEILARLPRNHPSFQKMSGILNEHVASLLKRVDKRQGLKTLIDDGAASNSFETSASALFAYTLMKGARTGLLPAADAREGRALALNLFSQFKKLDTAHTSVTGISCPTTATTFDIYYTKLVGTCPDQSYGVGAVLLMLSEL